MSTLRQEIQEIVARLCWPLAPSELATIRGELIQTSIRAGELERLADELVAASIHRAQNPPNVVVRFPRRPIPVLAVGDEA